MTETIGTASAEMTCSESSRTEPTVRAAENSQASVDQKETLTQAEAQARVREGEELVFANCPCCKQRLAVYIARDSGATVDLPRLQD